MSGPDFFWLSSKMTIFAYLFLLWKSSTLVTVVEAAERTPEAATVDADARSIGSVPVVEGSRRTEDDHSIGGTGSGSIGSSNSSSNKKHGFLSPHRHNEVEDVVDQDVGDEQVKDVAIRLASGRSELLGVKMGEFIGDLRQRLYTVLGVRKTNVLNILDPLNPIRVLGNNERVVSGWWIGLSEGLAVEIKVVGKIF